MNNTLSAIVKRLHVVKFFGLFNKTTWSIVFTVLRRKRSMEVTLGSMKFTVLDHEFDTFKEIFVDSEYLLCLRHTPNVRPNFIVDLGANVGFASLFFQHVWPSVEVYAFEPVPDTFDRLVRNVKDLNGVLTHNKSAGCDDCEVTFTSDGPGSRMITSEMSMAPSCVTCTQIDIFRFIQSTRFSSGGLLKMDIEGGEWNIFADQRISQLLAKFDTVILEVHETSSGSVQMFEQTYLDGMQKCGWRYEAVRILPQWATVYVVWRQAIAPDKF